MDWTAAIERNREALKRILAMLVAMAGVGSGETTLPRHLHRAVLRLLRPAEAAARRLVVALARDVVAVLSPRRPRKPGPTPTILRNGVGTGIVMPPDALPRPAARPLALPLLDPLRDPLRRRQPSSGGVPRICFPGFSEPFPVVVHHPPLPGDPVDAARLDRRLAALGRALDDLPAQARRFARWRAHRDAVSAQDRNRDAAGAHAIHHRRGRFRRISPLRPGRPPGWRRRPVHEVHDVLDVAHWLAFQALKSPDTS